MSDCLLHNFVADEWTCKFYTADAAIGFSSYKYAYNWVGAASQTGISLRHDRPIGRLTAHVRSAGQQL